MKTIRNFLLFAVAIISVFSVSASAQTNVYGKNTEQGIERKVFKEILSLPYYGVFDSISFKVENGVVYLYGNVVQPTTKSQAQRYVQGIQGVTEVVNTINVLPYSSFDDRIRSSIVREFDRNGGGLYRYLQGTNPSMRIIVNNGHVSLEGYVANRGDYNLANILANGVSGTFSVKNNLIIEKD